MCKQFFGGFAKKWNASNQKFVQYYSHRPPIYRFTITLSENKFSYFQRNGHNLHNLTYKMN